MESTHPTESKSPRVIKRYANRKLYDTRDSRYVTLQQIAEYVKSGEDVTIIDNTTKEDLTNATLAQIVYEAEKNSGETGRPRTMGTLRSLIQNGNELIQSSSERLMSSLREGPMGKLITRREPDEKSDAGKAEPSKSEPVKVEPATADAKAETDESKGERKNLLLSPKDAIDELQRLADERVRVVLGTAIQSVHQLQSEVMRLHARIEELEQKLVEVQKRRGGADDASGPTHRESQGTGSDRS
ncbi:MAG: hypothetical protein K1X94_31140 [Sandaracinaceae bacterium]|nr:hypothetical protein [Sandaracinaceae bacterium]